MVGTRRKRGLVELEPSKEKQATKPKMPRTSGAENVALKVLLNPLIMGKIIKHLPLRCLPTLRSTCQSWNNLMAVEYRDRKANAHPYLVEINQVTLDSVLDTLNEATEIPFSAYSFTDIQMNTTKVQKLVDKVGGVMSRLHLDLTKLSLPIETFRTLLFKQCHVLRSLRITDQGKPLGPTFWTSKLQDGANEGEEGMTLPNLKYISLGIWTKYKLRIFPLSCFGLIRELLNAANNLETLKINEFGPYGIMLNGLILDILLKKQESGNLHKIKNIKLGKGINFEALVELSSRKHATVNRLGLKTLDLYHFLSDGCFLYPGSADARVMNEFLILQASSLEKLTASFGDDHAHKKYKVTLPIMPSLKTLKLKVEYSSPPPAYANANADPNAAIGNDPMHMLPNIRFESLNTNFPNLQKLELIQMDWMMQGSNDDEDEEVISYRAKKTAFLAQLASHHGITELNIALDADDSSYLVDYASLFPNVKTLTVFFPTELYVDVWSAWPSLEFLTIRLFDHPGLSEIDPWITGIPTQSLKLLKKASSRSVNKTTNGGQSKGNAKKEKIEELDWKQYKTQAGISDLHQLHAFNLYFIVGGVSANRVVTDLSANYGFIPIASNYKLRKIYIERFSKFSPKVVAAVEASLGLHGDFVPIDEGVKRQDEEMSKRGRHCYRR